MDLFHPISGLGDIAETYNVLLCDIWGVVHNGREGFEPAIEALMRFRQDHGVVILLSNSPRPSVSIPEQFHALGIGARFWDGIVTSGDATIDELARRAPGPAFKLGPERDDRLYDTLEMNFSDLGAAKFISCTGLFDDETETPEDYRELFAEALSLELPLVCANPDIKVVRGEREIYCGGALAQLYEKMGGEVIYAGKPHPPIYRLARFWIKESLGFMPPLEKILTIGDNIFTDLLGAQNQNLDCLFIHGGVHGSQIGSLKTLLERHNIHARYMRPDLIW